MFVSTAPGPLNKADFFKTCNWHIRKSIKCVVQMWESHTEVLLLVAVVAAVVLLVAQKAGVDAVAVVTAELGWHFTCNVDWSKKDIKRKMSAVFHKRVINYLLYIEIYHMNNTEQTKQDLQHKESCSSDPSPQLSEPSHTESRLTHRWLVHSNSF